MNIFCIEFSVNYNSNVQTEIADLTGVEDGGRFCGAGVYHMSDRVQ